MKLSWLRLKCSSDHPRYTAPQKANQLTDATKDYGDLDDCTYITILILRYFLWHNSHSYTPCQYSSRASSRSTQHQLSSSGRYSIESDSQNVEEKKCCAELLAFQESSSKFENLTASSRQMSAPRRATRRIMIVCGKASVLEQTGFWIDSFSCLLLPLSLETCNQMFHLCSTGWSQVLSLVRMVHPGNVAKRWLGTDRSTLFSTGPY